MNQEQHFLRTTSSVNIFLRDLEGGGFESLRSLDNLTIKQAIQITKVIYDKHKKYSENKMNDKKLIIFHSSLKDSWDKILTGLRVGARELVEIGIKNYRKIISKSQFDFYDPGVEIIFEKLPSMVSLSQTKPI